MRITGFKLPNHPPRQNLRCTAASDGSSHYQKHTLEPVTIVKPPKNGDGATETARIHCGFEHPSARPARAKVGAWQVTAVRFQDRRIAILRNRLPNLLRWLQGPLRIGSQVSALLEESVQRTEQVGRSHADEQG